MNMHPKTVEGFGFEWTRFDQSALPEEDLCHIFDGYFRIFPWDKLSPDAVGFDLGCGSGRWAKRVAPRVGILHCIDASAEALSSARRNLPGVFKPARPRSGKAKRALTLWPMRRISVCGFGTYGTTTFG